MRGRIIRMIDKSMHKDPTCVICGEAKRKNKGRFEVALPCGYRAEVPICRTCSGEEGAMRQDAIELPFVDPHYHLTTEKGRTFWDYRDVLNWIRDFMQAPAPIEKRPGIHVISITGKEIEFFRCEGKPPQIDTVTKNDSVVVRS